MSNTKQIYVEEPASVGEIDQTDTQYLIALEGEIYYNPPGTDAQRHDALGRKKEGYGHARKRQCGVTH